MRTTTTRSGHPRTFLLTDVPLSVAAPRADREEARGGQEGPPRRCLNAAPASKKAGKSVEEIYQKKTQLEHILLRPDTYVGSCEKTEALAWVYDKETNKLVQRQMTFVPGLYKIFDEILVNATDNKVRDPTMVTLRADIDQEAGCVRVYNDGNGIPVEMHKEEGVYVPELIFGHLLTSSNYDDNEKKVTGGRNGYGAKLANIFSKEFVIETATGPRASLPPGVPQQHDREVRPGGHQVQVHGQLDVHHVQARPREVQHDLPGGGHRGADVQARVRRRW